MESDVSEWVQVVFVLSGDYIMILDPCGLYLPPRQNRKRYYIFRRVKDMWRFVKEPVLYSVSHTSHLFRSYPDVLGPFLDLFGFSLGMESYPGVCLSVFFIYIVF